MVEEEEGEESEGSGDPVVNAALDKDKSGPRCTKGGKRHDVSVCSTNMEKVKCYKCGKAGHISLNCRVKTGDKDVSKGSSTGKSGITSVAPSTSRKVSKVRAKVLESRVERKAKCLRWSMIVALGGTLKIGVTISLLRKRRVLNLMASKSKMCLF